MVEELATQQDDNEKEVRGPPAAKAFDAEGNVTKVWFHLFDCDVVL